MATAQMQRELDNTKVNSVAERIWEEALAQPEFAKVQVIYAYAPMSSSDHRNGRCCDFMITIPGVPRDEQIEIGNGIRAYFVRHAARLDVQGIIWNRGVTGFPENGNVAGAKAPTVTYRGPSGQRRAYNGASTHTDHVHVQVSGRAVTKWLDAPSPVKPSKPAEPDPAGDYPRPKTTVVYLDKIKKGQKGSDSVYWVQRRLRELGYDDVKKTGTYDEATVKGADAWQAKVGNDLQYRGGVLGWNDLHALFKGMSPRITIERSSK